MKSPVKVETEIVDISDNMYYKVRATLSQRIVKRLQPGMGRAEPIMDTISAEAVEMGSKYSEALDDAVDVARRKLQKTFDSLPKKVYYLNI